MGKKKLNLSVKEDLIKYAKHLAIKEDTTVSELLEDYLMAIKNSDENVLKAIKDINLRPKKSKAK